MQIAHAGTDPVPDREGQASVTPADNLCERNLSRSTAAHLQAACPWHVPAILARLNLPASLADFSNTFRAHCSRDGRAAPGDGHGIQLAAIFRK